MYSKSGTGYVLIITPATHEVNSGRKGVDGKEIIVDIAFNPMHYALNYAKVHQIPVDMGSGLLMQKHCGPPGYGPVNTPHDLNESPSPDLYAIGGVYKYKYISDIVADVKVGDTIYFKPRTLNNARNYMGALKNERGTIECYIYKVPYENIFCAVRKDKIIMIGGWVLARPIYEDWKDILVPTYFPFQDRFGDPVQRPQSEWIQNKVAPTFDNQRAILAHVGKPLKDEYFDLSPGDTVVFRKQASTFFQYVEKEKYIILSQDMILGSLQENIKIQ